MKPVPRRLTPEEERAMTRELAWDYIHSMVERIKVLERRIAELEVKLMRMQNGRRVR